MTDQELIERVLTEHWLLLDGDGAITGCHCGFVAETDSDCGYGDSVLKHFAGMVIASARKAVAAEIRVAMPASDRYMPRQTWIGMCDAYRHSADIAGGAPIEEAGMYDIARLVTDEVLGSGAPTRRSMAITRTRVSERRSSAAEQSNKRASIHR